MSLGPAQLVATARLTLHPTSPDHAAALYPLMRDERVTTFLAWSPHASADETRAVLTALARAHAEGVGYHWTIIREGVPCGIISLIDVRRTHRTWTLDRAEIAYWLGVPWQGIGIAGEATAAVVDIAFGALALHRLIVSHTSLNAASGRIPQRLGFRHIGVEYQYFCKNGIWHDMNHYELLADDWHARRGVDSP